MASDIRKAERSYSHYVWVDGTARGIRNQREPTVFDEPAVYVCTHGTINKSIEYVSHPIKLYNSI